MKTEKQFFKNTLSAQKEIKSKPKASKSLIKPKDISLETFMNLIFERLSQ